MKLLVCSAVALRAIPDAVVLYAYKIKLFDKSHKIDIFITQSNNAGIAQLVERCLAKAKVAGSSPVSRSIRRRN